MHDFTVLKSDKLVYELSEKQAEIIDNLLAHSLYHGGSEEDKIEFWKLAHMFAGRCDPEDYGNVMFSKENKHGDVKIYTSESKSIISILVS